MRKFVKFKLQKANFQHHWHFEDALIFMYCVSLTYINVIVKIHYAKIPSKYFPSCYNLPGDTTSDTI